MIRHACAVVIVALVAPHFLACAETQITLSPAGRIRTIRMETFFRRAVAVCHKETCCIDQRSVSPNAVLGGMAIGCIAGAAGCAVGGGVGLISEAVEKTVGVGNDEESICDPVRLLNRHIEK